MLYKIREFYLKKIFCNEIIEKIFYYLIPDPYPLYNLLKIDKIYNVSNPVDDYKHYVTMYNRYAIQRCIKCNKISMVVIRNKYKTKIIDFGLCYH